LTSLSCALTFSECVVAQIAPDPDWERQLSKLRTIVQNGLTEQGEFQGSKNQCEDELRRLNEQLKGFRKADEEYRTTLITVRRMLELLGLALRTSEILHVASRSRH
jgi:hypothetical protein